MHATQITYMHAKAYYDAILKEENRRVDAIIAASETMTPEEFDRIFRDCTETPELEQAYDALREAENEMMDWAYAVVKPLARNDEERAALELMQTQRHKPLVRRKLVELAFLLEAPTGTLRKTRKAA